MANKKRLTIHSTHILEFPNENGEEHNDEGTLAEIGVIAYLQSHTEWIVTETFTIGSQIVESTEGIQLDI